MANDVVIHVKAVDTASKTLAKTGTALKSGIVAAAGIAGAALVKFGLDSVTAAMEAQKAQTRLGDAFARFPKLADTNIGRLNALNSALQLKTAADDESIASGQAVLAQFGLTGKQLEQMTPLLVDYARKTGKEMPDAAKALGKAIMGNGRALKELGIDFKDTGDPAKNLEVIMQGLREKVGGFAEKEGKTLAGRLEILRNRFGEIQEKVGTALLPVLEDLASAIGKTFDEWESSGKMAEDLDDLAGAARNAQEAFKGFGKANARFVEIQQEQRAGILKWRIAMLRGISAVLHAWALINPRMRKVAEGVDKMLAEARADFNRTTNEINRKKVEPKIRANIADLEGKIRTAKRRLQETNDKKTQARIRANISQLQGQVRLARLALMSVRDRSVNITTTRRTVYVGGGRDIGYAQGGNVGAAADGGPRSGQILVGERGPEVVQLPMGSHVSPNGNTASMMGGRGRGGTTINVYANNYVGTPADLLRALVDAKRRGQLDVILR